MTIAVQQPKTNQKRGGGRPPEGLGKGDEPARISDYPRALFIIRPRVKAQLKAVAKAQSRAAWQVVEDALAVYFDQLRAEELRAFDRELRTAGQA